jgi:hypothetical protein
MSMIPDDDRQIAVLLTAPRHGPDLDDNCYQFPSESPLCAQSLAVYWPSVRLSFICLGWVCMPSAHLPYGGMASAADALPAWCPPYFLANCCVYAIIFSVFAHSLGFAIDLNRQSLARPYIAAFLGGGHGPRRLRRTGAEQVYTLKSWWSRVAVLLTRMILASRSLPSISRSLCTPFMQYSTACWHQRRSWGIDQSF